MDKELRRALSGVLLCTSILFAGSGCSPGEGTLPSGNDSNATEKMQLGHPISPSEVIGRGFVQNVFGVSFTAREKTMDGVAELIRSSANRSAVRCIAIDALNMGANGGASSYGFVLFHQISPKDEKLNSALLQLGSIELGKFEMEFFLRKVHNLLACPGNVPIPASDEGTCAILNLFDGKEWSQCQQLHIALVLDDAVDSISKYPVAWDAVIEIGGWLDRDHRLRPFTRGAGKSVDELDQYLQDHKK